MQATIPHQPLGFWSLLGETRRIFGAHYLTFLGIVALPEILLAIFRILLLGSLGISEKAIAWGLSSVADTPGLPWIIAFGVLNIALRSVIAGAAAYAVALAERGQPISILATYRAAARWPLALSAAGILSCLATIVGLTLFGFAMGFLGLDQQPETNEQYFIHQLLFYSLLFIAVLVAVQICKRLIFAVQAIVVEDCGLLKGMAWSRHLVQGQAVRTFGTYFLLLLLTYVLPSRIMRGGMEQSLFGIVAYALLEPFFLVGVTLLYFDLRRRAERIPAELASDGR